VEVYPQPLNSHLSLETFICSHNLPIYLVTNHMVNKIFEIPVYNLPILEEKIGKLNRRGEKIGADPITVTMVDEPYEKIFNEGEGNSEFVITMQKVLVIGKAPKMNGWTLVAVVEPAEGGVLLRKFPGTELEIPVDFRDVTPDRCDHCHTKRRRNETFIVHHKDGGWKVVGRDCLSDFTGYRNPEQVADFASVLYDLSLSIEETYGYSGGGGHGYYRAPIWSFLEKVALYTIRYGFVTGKKAMENRDSDNGGKTISTGHEVFDDWFSGYYSRYAGHNSKAGYEFLKGVSEDEDKKASQLVVDAMDYGKTQFVEQDENDLSDFGHNMKLLLGGDYVRSKDAGYVASIIPIYLRSKQQTVDYKKSTHVGQVNDKITKKMTVLRVYRWEGNYGEVDITTLQDEDGNIYTWFAKPGKAPEAGAAKTITGKIKRHDVRNGNKTTVLGYVKVAA